MEHCATLVELNPVRGVELFRRHRSEIALVLLDLTMPEMPGKDVAVALKAIDPSVKIIISSGYSEEEMSKRIGGLKVSAFIQKPYRAQALGSMVRSLIHENGLQT
jgi:YesN/AraC family two-component response regulator